MCEFDVPVTLRDATRVIHAGLPAPVQGAPFLPGPVFASAFHAQGAPTDAPFAYTREGHPTWENFERALSELEGGNATLFASGVAAIAAVFGVALRPGDLLAIGGDAYYGARGLAKAESEARGIEVREVVMPAFRPADLDGARLVWFESPSNPNLDVADVAEIVLAARERGVLVAMDNTTATMLAQRPLQMGVDFSMMSDTKSLCGHADLLLGHVAVRDPELHARLRDWRQKTGAIAGPMEAWLAHRSLATLEMRLARQCDNALRIATFLAGNPAVRGVRYPGLPGDPSYALAARQMRSFGPVLGFTLGDRGAAERFLSACRLVREATSFGGVITTAERRARWGGDDVGEGFIRFSAGCEDPDDLQADIAQALAQT